MNLENDMISWQYSDKTLLRNLENGDNAGNTPNTGHAGDMENSGNSVKPLARCLHELIETGVKQHPDAEALWFEGETLSYDALNQRANQCARYLRELGEGPNQIVAVVMERSVEMMVALLGILKAGAAYLPLDPHYPRKRLNLILADAGVSVVLTQHSFEDQLTDFDGTIINLDNEWDYLAKMPNTDLIPVAAPDDLAYVIYTSGSTGKPKGCMISHKAICNRLIWMQRQYQVTGNDLILQKTPFTFDVSVWELFLPLLSGAGLVMAKPKGHQDNAYLIDTITQKGITICHFVPSMLRFFLNQPRVTQCQSLKHVFVSGEALPAELMKQFKRLLPAKLHNLYGPTEAAVDVTYWECTERADNLVPIGRPIPNIQIYILDSDLKPVPTGQTGELYIGGIGLAKGYLNRRELTEKTFINNPFSTNEHSRLYKSGDKARYLPDGNIDYLGRLDFQVKLRGLRIELGEIELTLNAHEAVAQSIVVVKDQDTDDPKLVAYIVTQQDLNPKQLREFLKKELPEYMVPNLFVPIANIPVTSHGKVDRKSLPWPIRTGDTEPTGLPEPLLEPLDPKPDTSKLISELVRMFSELLNITKIQANDDLFDCGATSFTMVQVVEKIQNRYGVVIPVEVFLDDPNVAAIAAYLASVLPTPPQEPINGRIVTPQVLPPVAAEQTWGKTGPSILNQLLEIFSQMLSNPKITVSDDLFDLGATSFTLVQAIEKIQQRLGVSVPVDVFLEAPRVDAITAYVEKECDKQADKKINCKSSCSSSQPAQLPSNSAAIKLQSADFSDIAYDMAVVQRNFSGKTVSFTQFSQFLGLLKPGCVNDKSKYLYPSAGGLNSTQTYLFIKKDGVSSLPEGAYYYHPIEHSLYPLAVPAHIDPAIMGAVNRKRFNQCGFALFLIVQLNAIWPIYKILSPSLSVLDAGYMSQLLLSRGQEFGLTLSPAVGVDFSPIRSMFLLEKSHRFIHCILGGNADNVDMASSATDLLTDYLKRTGNGIFDHCKHYTGAETFSDYLNVKNEKLTLPTKSDKKDLKPDAHLRQFSGSLGRIRLEPVPNVDEAYYHARSTKRDYVEQPIPFSQFSLFLSLLAPKRINGQPRFLYSSLLGYQLKYYLYIPKNGVEGVPEGVYRYDPERLSLHQVTSALSKNIKMSHYPFNRTHVQKSKFCLFLFAPLAELTPVYKEESIYLALLEAGTVGQLLMDKQAEFEIGLCPIGGMRFEKIRADFEQSDHALQPTDELLHSFVGGQFQVKMPADWHFLATAGQRQLNISDSYQKIERSKTPPTLNQEIAIVGMSGRYPGATNLEEYWDNLTEGISSFSELWFDQAVHYRRNSHHTTTPVEPLSLTQRSSAFRHYAAFLDDVDCFDSLLFNITPAEAKQLDPQERLMLEVVWECLENAGYTSKELNRSAGQVGVFVGAMWNDYQHHAMDNWKHSQTPLAMSHHSAIPSRVSYFFNFSGPCVSLDTSCSSALAAIHYACNSLNNRECQAAIVGGVNIMSHPYHHGLLKSLDLLSADGECHPFGVKGSGWIAGEGVGAILIKPKINALKDGDTIYGLIKGSAIGHSGTSIRYGAPNTEKQTESILRAINNAGISPQSISYIEAAAPGASIADAAEMMALKTVFNNSTQTESMIYVGSVKSNIGHLESASAMSQLAKVLLQMKHQHLCPTRQRSDLNPMIRIEDSNLKIINQFSPWTPADGTPRRALINAFGATGTSGHLIVEEYIAPHSVESAADSQQLITLSAATEPQLMHLAKRLNTFLANAAHPLPQLADIAYTLRIGRVDMSERLAIVTDSHAELQEQLTGYISGSPTPGVYTGSSTENVGLNEKTLLNDLADIAKAWVSGIDYDWNKLVTGNEKRVPLPTYPFAKDRHWIEANSAETTSSEPSAHPPTHYPVTVKPVEFYLKQQISTVSEIPVSRIDSKARYDQLGMTSQMITQLTFKLENDLGHLPKTLFFEYQTIHDLAFYLLTNHLNQLSQVIAGQSKGVFDQLYTPSLASSPRKEASKASPVAIIGVAGRYPGANNLNEFWDNLKNGVDCISEIPTQRWNHSDYDQADFAPGTRLSKWGGFIEGVDQFDPLFFNISPREAELMDPQERLFLQTVWELFEEAGYSRDTCQTVFNRKIGVFVGVMYGEYQLLSPSLYQRGHGTVVGSAYGSIANRISFFFDLKGPSLALDTLCSSSLTALHLAVGSIQSGECNGAIVGGVNISIHPNKYIRQAQLNMPSTDGRCRSFGEGGNGFIPGEGVGAILLKPLDKAVADNDHIYAIINATAINHDGKTHGYTVPNPNAQAEMIAAALNQANLDPRQISYVEAHGTGTALGDPVEIAGLTQAFGNLKNRPRTCAIGSVKSNIGHLESAAGIAGLTKILLQFKHHQLVPSLHSNTLNPNIDFETGPFYVQQTLTEWKPPRIACISSFGAGGANAHAILSEYCDQSAPTKSQANLTTDSNTPSAFMIPLSAKNRDRLREVAKRLLEFVHEVNEDTIAQTQRPTLAPIAYTLQVGRDALEERLGMVVHSTQELEEKLKQFLAGEQTGNGIYLGRVQHTQEAVFETQDELWAVLNKWVAQNQLSNILELWVKGVTVDWNKLVGPNPPKKISLPTYPFANARYWVPEPTPQAGASSPHPEIEIKTTSRDEVGNNKSNHNNALPYSRLLATPVWREAPLQKNPGKPLNLLRQIILCELPQINGQIVESHFPQGRCIKLTSNESTLDGRLTEYAIQCFFHIRQIIDQNRQAPQNKDNTLIQLIIPNEAAAILFTALSGLFKTATLEHPRIWGQVLQVSPAETTQGLLEKLIDNSQLPQDDVVRYTDLKRLVSDWKIMGEPKEVTQYGFRDKGVYLITGGLGGLGRIFVNEIVQQTHYSTLILTGRSELSLEKQTFLKQLQEQNNTIHIEYRQTNVNEYRPVTELIKSICDQYGTLVGIIHCAGSICDNLIVNKSAEEFRQVLAPKVSGTLNLDRATADLDLELFVLFSSLSGVTGNLGQADYAVANGFLDQFAHYRTQLVAANQRRGITISINWPLWEEGGMDIDEVSKRMMIQSTGLIPLPTTTGIQSFYQGIAIAQPQVMVMEGAFEKIKNTFFSGHPTHHLAQESRLVDSKILREKTLYQIKKLFGEVIKLPAAQVDEAEPLESYGIDSVMIAHFNQKLMEVFGDISRTLLFEYQTLNELTDYFIANFSVTCCAWTKLDRWQEKVSLPNSIPQPHDTNLAYIHLPEHRFDPIAIVGISGLYPQADTLERYWENLKSGKTCITKIPANRWSLDSFYEPKIQEAVDKGKSYSQWGGFLDSFAHFDPLFFNISPREAKQMDPQERLFLQAAWQAMENAGYTRSILKEVYHKRVGVFAGITRSGFNRYGYYTSFCSVANRLSFFLDLQGPSMPVDTMCSSSLTAIHEACRYLHSGECELAFAGGVNLYLHPSEYVSLCSQKMLSPDGLCKSFGCGGNGFVPGEGVGVVILKRLSAALADRDTIHAVIRATHVNHGGKTNGYTVPNPTAQADLIRHTLDKAGLTADQISYIEAHGTGTELGDPIEITGLTQAFQKDTQATGFCKIGSVKSNIGHLESAAGIAGLTKIILQMKHGQVAPSLHAQTLNPNIRFETTPFVVNQTLSDWEQPICNGQPAPRRAGISSFGAGGSNAHIIVEEYMAKTPEQSVEPTDAVIIPLSARTKAQLKQRASSLLTYLESTSPHLTAVAYTLQTGREAMEERLGVMVNSVSELKETLAAFCSGAVNIENFYQGRVKDNKEILGLFSSNEELQEAVDKWIQRKKWSDLLKIWVKGLNVDWNKLYVTTPPKRLNLPTYPFANDQYWLSEQPTPFEVRQSEKSEVNHLVIHPLLHQNTSTLLKQRYSTTLTGTEFFLADHQVNGERILPGVSYLEMSRAAVENASEPVRNGTILRLKNVVWPQPVVVNHSAQTVHISLFNENLTGSASGQIHYEVYSYWETDDTTPRIHSQGVAEFTEQGPAVPLEVATLRNQMQQGTINASQCYQTFKRLGLDYGPSFQGIQKIYRGENQALAEISLPETVLNTGTDYVLHPSIMDAALQTSIALLPASAIGSGTDQEAVSGDLVSAKAALPFAMESIDIQAPCTRNMIAWTRLAEGSALSKTVQKIDLDLCDEVGNIAVKIRGYSSRVLDGAVNTIKPTTSVGTLLATPTWKELPAIAEFPSLTVTDHYVWLGGFSEITPSEIESSLTGSVCLALNSLDSVSGTDDTQFTDIAVTCFQKIQDIIAKQPQGNILIQLVVPDTGKDALLVGLGGLLKTAMLENPKLLGQVIQFDRQETSETLVTKLRENIATPKDFRIRYRNALRWVSQWEPTPQTPLTGHHRFKDQGVYLITGGLGGLGVIFAKEMLKTTQNGSLILTGRSSLSEQNQPLLAELVRLGKAHSHSVEYLVADMSNAEQVQELIKHIEQTYHSLTGIIHSAGLIRDSFILKKTVEQFRAVLSPKVSGTMNLDRATQTIDLEMFVLFSSIAAPFGNFGQADYAIANGFMDQFAWFRNQLVEQGQRRGKTLAINWPFWRSGGMQIDAASEAVMKALSGMHPMETSEGISAFYHALEISGSQLLVMAGNLAQLTAFLANTSLPPLNQPERDGDTSRFMPKLRAVLLQTLAEILQLNTQDLNEIDPNSEFNEFGFDSISLTDLANQLNRKFLLELAPTLFFEHPTINRLLDYLGNEYGPQLAKSFKIEPTPVRSLSQTIQRSRAVKVASPGVVSTKPPVTTDPLEPLAIIGISGCFPKAETLDEFWENLVQETDCISEIPKDRWDWKAIYGDPQQEVNRSNIKWGGFLRSIAEFDPLFFGISPKEAELMDPQQRLLMTHLYWALEDAGYSPQAISGTKTGIFVGTGSSGYSGLVERAGIAIEGYTSTGLVPSMGPNRLSYFLNLHGPSTPVETACSSSLIAIHRAVQAIREGACTAAFVGGVNAIVAPEVHISFNKAGMLCEDGRCKTFSSQANGYVRGEGAGILFIKPLTQAEADGDHIYGLIRATGENHGGRANSLTSPNPNAQAELIQTVYKRAGIDPKTVGYIETHGTGTQLGDPIEINGLKLAFNELFKQFGENTSERAFCGLGSVKTNIGHLELAAGIAGVIKVLLQFKHKRLVKSLHCDTLNPYIDLNNSPFYIVQEAAEWTPITDQAGHALPRRAGVSSFGFGGSNAHIVLEEYITLKTATNTSPTTKTDSTNAMIIPLSAKTPEQLQQRIRQLLSFILTNPIVNLESLAYTLQVGRDAMTERFGLIVHSVQELKSALESYLSGDTPTNCFWGQAKRMDDNDTVPLWADKTEILARWVNGLAFDWHRIYKTPTPKRISLPTYPFATDRYWVTEQPDSSMPERQWLFLKDQWVDAPIDATNRQKNLNTYRGKQLLCVYSDPAEFDRFGNVFSEMVTPLVGTGLVDLKGISIDAVAMDFPEVVPAVVFYLGANRSIRDSHQANENPVKAAFDLSQILMKTGWGARVDIYYVYDGSATHPPIEIKGLSGFFRAAMMENPNHVWNMIEFNSDGSLFSKFHAVVSEWLCVPFQENKAFAEVSYKNSHRQIRTLQETCLEVSKNSQFKPGGVYLITDGLGTLGMLLCEKLAREYGAHLIILTPTELEHSQEKQCNQLESLGATVDHYSVDIGDERHFRETYQAIKQKVGVINGVIHLARSINDEPILLRTWESFAKMIRTQVQGTIFLDVLTAQEPLDFFILYSSMAAFGIKGASDYGYSTAFQNAFAYYRNQLQAASKRSGITISQCWGAWTIDVHHPVKRDQEMKAAGFEMITIEDAFPQIKASTTYQHSMLGMMLVSDYEKAKQALGLTGKGLTLSPDLMNLKNLETHVKRWEEQAKQGVPITVQTIKKVIAFEAIQSLTPELTDRIYQLLLPAEQEATLPKEQEIISIEQSNLLHAKTVDYIKSVFKELLKLKPDNVKENEPFNTYGIDSITMMGLFNRFESVVGNLPQSLRKNCKTVNELSHYFITKHGDTLTALLMPEQKVTYSNQLTSSPP